MKAHSNIRIMNCVLLTALALCLFSSGGAFAEDPSFTVEQDVIYGHKDGLAMTMDVFQQREPDDNAALIVILSGGWVSKRYPLESTQAFVTPYLEMGCTVFAVRHGSSPRYGIPDATADIRRAVRFVRAKAERFNIDETRIGVLGMSAGGHLALLMATTGDDGDPEADDPVLRASSRVKTAVAVVPPSDLRPVRWEAETSLPFHKELPALDLDEETAAEYSPLLHVDAGDAPALIVSALKDEIVPPEHGEWIAEAYEKAGVKNKLLMFDTNHGIEGKHDELFAAIREWLDEQL